MSVSKTPLDMIINEIHALRTDLVEEMRLLRHAVDALCNDHAPDADESDVEISTAEAAEFMGYSKSSHACFRDAARDNGVFPTGNRARFRWRKSDLLRWKASPKYAMLRVRIHSGRLTRRAHK
ncbi:hypothetical protein CKA38_11060 [Ereboglobus luteus]|uniref:Helix-turn-helix domain-containing protein n=1 Tax=Ereboglobus luteus TaxID=1796921 RepID=A0A2U8E4H5_9BACT|nr:hypothetical protein CKA38_11060 [Ereboglobus luteus]